MHALQFDSSGGGPVGLKHVEIPVPTPGEGDVLLKLEATSLNPVDWKTHKLKALLNPLLPRQCPLVPATDVAGEVVGVGPGVQNFKTGDKVVAMLGYLGGGGLAEYGVTKEMYAVPRPPEVSAPDGSCLPVAGLTAHMAITKTSGINLNKNEPQRNVLITAASGGVGHYAVQLAKLGNAHVTATCGARNIDFVRSLGADEVLDYKTPEGESLKSPSGKKYDAVIHCAATRYPWSVFEPNLSENGIVVDITAGAGEFWTITKHKLTFSKKKLLPLLVEFKNENLKCLVELMKEGKLKTVIDSKHPLSKAEDAWAKMIDGHATGKLVVEQ